MNKLLEKLLGSLKKRLAEFLAKIGVGEKEPVADKFADQIDLNGTDIVWRHFNVSGWAKTANLSPVSVSGSRINLPYDKANVWAGRNTAGAFVNANPWIFVKMNGFWYAATWEWMGKGQTSKAVAAVAGDHIKISPLNDFKPVSGETYGFMISGLCRDATRNVSERSNVVLFKWP
jgi:hypothetical protein